MHNFQGGLFLLPIILQPTYKDMLNAGHACTHFPPHKNYARVNACSGAPSRAAHHVPGAVIHRVRVGRCPRAVVVVVAVGVQKGAATRVAAVLDHRPHQPARRGAVLRQVDVDLWTDMHVRGVSGRPQGVRGVLWPAPSQTPHGAAWPARGNAGAALGCAGVFAHARCGVHPEADAPCAALLRACIPATTCVPTICPRCSDVGQHSCLGQSPVKSAFKALRSAFWVGGNQANLNCFAAAAAMPECAR